MQGTGGRYTGMACHEYLQLADTVWAVVVPAFVRAMGPWVYSGLLWLEP